MWRQRDWSAGTTVHLEQTIITPGLSRVLPGNISLPSRNQRGREARAAVRTWSGETAMLVSRSVTEATEGRGGKPRGGRVKVLTGAGLVLTEGWKSLITIWLSFCCINLSARLIISLVWSGHAGS